MNTPQMGNACQEIYRDFTGMGREKQDYDKQILGLIIYMYNHTEIDWEEVKWLWIEYLKTGNLDFYTAIQNARERIAYARDIRETEEELLHWLHRGVY